MSYSTCYSFSSGYTKRKDYNYFSDSSGSNLEYGSFASGSASLEYGSFANGCSEKKWANPWLNSEKVNPIPNTTAAIAKEEELRTEEGWLEASVPEIKLL